MQSDRGAVIVAYGQPARNEAEKCISDLRQSNPGLPVAVVSDAYFPGADVQIEAPDFDPGARWAKLNINIRVPWPTWAYLDADTRPRASLSAGFEVLADGWELVIVPSGNQGADWLWHATDREREATRRIYEGEPLQLQGGVWWCRRSPRSDAFFEAWREEWQVYEGPDQGALLRALMRVPLRVWLLGRPWNGGALIAHLFGRARRR